MFPQNRKEEKIRKFDERADFSPVEYGGRSADALFANVGNVMRSPLMGIWWKLLHVSEKLLAIRLSWESGVQLM